ncbi:MAG: hypothetical protein LBL05_05065 [Synergistaceae bacterium]|nr:hypothetical protein [Synergistaceae bacterium]
MSASHYRAVITAFFAIVLTIFFAPRAEAADKCGVVEKLTQRVTAVRGSQEIELSAGDDVYAADVIKAGQSGYAEIKLVDDTLIAFGGNGVITLAEVQFSVGGSRLHMSVDRGAVWISIGSIGLVDAGAVKITTPSLLVSSGNATLQFETGDGDEKLKVQWLNKGGKVEVYNNRTKERLTLMEPDITLSVSGREEMTVAPTETEPEPETPPEE